MIITSSAAGRTASLSSGLKTRRDVAYGTRRDVPQLILLALVLLGLLLTPRAAVAGQLGSLLSPGALAKAHQSLDGAKCQQCHEAGRKVSAARCLTCHKPITDRIAARKGVHRQATDCVGCHVEHAGVNADLRHLDTRTFNHTTETGFPLAGVHTKVAVNCASCHKGRSFLDAKPDCSSCHADTHKGALGADCVRCHSTTAAFKAARSQFDHSKAQFQLIGGHRRITCEQCHKNAVFKSVAFATCTSCHQEPHERRFSATCTSCHATDNWKTKTVAHARTRFPLVGAHVQVTCAKCHTTDKMTDPLRFDRCSTCHTNVHRDSIKENCDSCHSNTSFKGGKFDHATQTTFALAGKHTGLACVKCHRAVSGADVPLARKTADFGGAKTACVSCHADKDPHKGAYGRACDSCHGPDTFSVKDFRHPRDAAFFGGQHQPVACEKCHAPDRSDAPMRAGATSMACVSCHADVHLGQLANACDQCHTVDGSKFKAVAFSHDRVRLPLTGKHESTPCEKCHATETRAFPARSGTAVRFKPIDTACRTCHTDPHLGQLDQLNQRCDTCHATTTFLMGSSFVHRGIEDFFRGFHGRYTCKHCHKQERGQFPAGNGTAVRYIVGRTCAACHPQY